jgi:hypothetical protein
MRQHLDMWSGRRVVTAPVSSGVLDIYNDPNSGQVDGTSVRAGTDNTDSVSTVAVAAVPTEDGGRRDEGGEGVSTAASAASEHAPSFWEHLVSMVTPRGSTGARGHPPPPAVSTGLNGGGGHSSGDSEHGAGVATGLLLLPPHAAAVQAMADLEREEYARSAARSLVVGAREQHDLPARAASLAYLDRVGQAEARRPLLQAALESAPRKPQFGTLLHEYEQVAARACLCISPARAK